MGTYMNEKIIPKIMKLINTKAVQSIKDGMIYSMPLLIVGSVYQICPQTLHLRAVVTLLHQRLVHSLIVSLLFLCIHGADQLFSV